jgi:transcriptional regulator with XRE-family HTH domain
MRNGLGSAIRKSRKAQSLTLKQLAERTGFTHSYISQVERGLIMPSLSALQELAAGLSISASDLIKSYETPAVNAEKALARVVRNNERLVLIYPGSDIRTELLLPEYYPDFSIAWLTFDPGSQDYMHRHEHSGMHFGVVVSGELRFYIGAEDYTLERGDAIHFDASVHHRWVNESGEIAELVVFTRPAGG